MRNFGRKENISNSIEKQQQQITKVIAVSGRVCELSDSRRTTESDEFSPHTCEMKEGKNCSHFHTKVFLTAVSCCLTSSLIFPQLHTRCHGPSKNNYINSISFTRKKSERENFFLSYTECVYGSRYLRKGKKKSSSSLSNREQSSALISRVISKEVKTRDSLGIGCTMCVVSSHTREGKKESVDCTKRKRTTTALSSCGRVQHNIQYINRQVHSLSNLMCMLAV